MEVGKRIAEIRKENRMSQEQFGQLFHVTRQTVSNWENAKSYPDLQTLVKISELFEITMDELLKENVPMVQKIDKERKAGKLISESVYCCRHNLIAACVCTACVVADGDTGGGT